MTREEAIQMLRKNKEQRGNCFISDALDMAIKALEQEPSGDLISRDELLKAIDTWDKFGCDADTKLVPYQDHYIPYIHYDDVIKCIKGVPSVNQEPKPKWTPISERLPKDGILCICTVYNTDVYRDNIQVYDNYLVYDEYTEQWIDNDMELFPYDVLAWMPYRLPEPYKAESEDKE